MRIRNLINVEDIVDWRLCLGCGACAYACPDNTRLVDILNTGIRPQIIDTNACSDCNNCLEVCPSYSVDFGQLKALPSYVPSVDKKTESDWGAITGIWEGYATDEEIRFKGSSGGALTALSLYCLQELRHGAVLHVAEDPDDPIRNKTRLSENREDLLTAVGSRYSPASVCDGLGLVENARTQCTVIGKPAEIAATRNAAKQRPILAEKIGLTLSFFCAETPPTQATLNLMEKFEVVPERLKTLRYRGYGWPGHFTTREGDEEPRTHWIYQKSWAYLQQFRPWSVHLWPDGSGELADISCGDPWYEEPDGKNPGFSLIVARTAKGKQVIADAIAKGYLCAEPAEIWKLEKSQDGLLRKKGSIWGRRLAHRMLGVPVTRFDNLNLFRPWLALSLTEKLKSTFGTVRRILQRGLYRPISRSSR